jgi:hypothetical protein
VAVAEAQRLEETLAQARGKLALGLRRSRVAGGEAVRAAG